MKKNAMLKIAAILLVAVLLTTCAISATFAKYVTTAGDPKSDTARVAKWGLTFTTSDPDIFATSYSDTDNDVVIAAVENSNNTYDNVVAPGASKEGCIEFTVSGAPEVATKLIGTATVTLEGWGDYCPLVFTVTGTTNPIQIDNTNVTTVSALEEALEKAIAEALVGGGTYDKTELKATKEYAPNQTVGTNGAYSVTVDWEWPFDSDSTKDNVLGNAAAADNAPEITIAYTIGAEQISQLS